MMKRVMTLINLIFSLTAPSRIVVNYYNIEFLIVYMGIIERYKISHLFAVSVKITYFNN